LRETLDRIEQARRARSTVAGARARRAARLIRTAPPARALARAAALSASPLRHARIRRSTE
jgi:hypothetical protein